jgi:DNA adenine methylase
MTPNSLEPEVLATLKWVGGKRRISNEIASHFPKSFGTYFEPFLGGGSVFFRAKPAKSHLSDLNTSLINYYLHLRDYPEALLKSAQKLQNKFNNLETQDDRKSFYYEIREKYNKESSKPNLQSATYFLFLNKTAFNGLYRENAKGHFNVPFNNSKTLKLLDPIQVTLNSKALSGTTLESCGYREAVRSAKSGDLVYFDPPYVPLSTTSAFTDYTKSPFGQTAQEELRDLALDLRARGVHVILSNSYSPIVKDLYEAFDLHQLRINRLVAAESSSRGIISEYLIVGLPNA